MSSPPSESYNLSVDLAFFFWINWKWQIFRILCQILHNFLSGTTSVQVNKLVMWGSSELFSSIVARTYILLNQMEIYAYCGRIDVSVGFQMINLTLKFCKMPWGKLWFGSAFLLSHFIIHSKKHCYIITYIILYYCIWGITFMSETINNCFFLKMWNLPLFLCNFTFLVKIEVILHYESSIFTVLMMFCS